MHFAFFTADVPRHSLESSSHNSTRKDSSNSISSIKEPDIPEPKNDMFSATSGKDKVDDINFYITAVLLEWRCSGAVVTMHCYTYIKKIKSFSFQSEDRTFAKRPAPNR